MNDEWYSPGQITFRREEMIFLIQSLPMLKEGYWPPNPLGSGYTEAPLSKKVRHHKAYFEIPEQFAYECEFRLEKTKSDGKILYWQLQAGINDYEDLEPDAKTALNYISGWRRRTSSYPIWKAKRRYAKKDKFIPVELKSREN